ncbi:MAG TPA: YciI family protein [Gaiellaceae bacterium]|nr:YciI family protein [Gaiellaceae bacterium]
MIFLLVSRYTAPLERIEALIPAHREYLVRLRDEGVLVVSGRRDPWTGGAIVLRGTRERAQAAVAEDPFTAAAAAETEIVAVDPLFWADGLERYL